MSKSAPLRAVIKEEYFALLDGSISAMLVLDRLVYRLFKKYGLTILQEELDGTALEDYSGWIKIDYGKLEEALIMQYDKKTVNRALEILEERGYMLVQRDPSPWKKPNKYRPCIKAIKEGLAKKGYPFVIDRVTIDENEIDWGEELVKNEPTTPQDIPVNATEEQEKDWDSIPSMNTETTPEQKDQVQAAREWAMRYPKILNGLSDHLRYASYIFTQLTGIEPNGTPSGWKKGIELLWDKCDKSMSLFIRALQRGMDVKMASKSPMTFYGPFSFIAFAIDVKATGKSAYVQQKQQEALRKQTTPENKPSPLGMKIVKLKPLTQT